MTDSLFLFAAIAGTAVAIRTSEVEAVVRLGDIVPIPLVPRHVRGLATLRSRVLTVIDMEAMIFGNLTTARPARLAVVADIAAHSYGFLVDSVSDICQSQSGVQPVRGRINGAWSPFVGGMVEREGRSHLLLTLTDFAALRGEGTLAA